MNQKQEQSERENFSFMKINQIQNTCLSKTHNLERSFDYDIHSTSNKSPESFFMRSNSDESYVRPFSFLEEDFSQEINSQVNRGSLLCRKRLSQEMNFNSDVLNKQLKDQEFIQSLKEFNNCTESFKNIESSPGKMRQRKRELKNREIKRSVIVSKTDFSLFNRN